MRRDFPLFPGPIGPRRYPRIPSKYRIILVALGLQPRRHVPVDPGRIRLTEYDWFRPRSRPRFPGGMPDVPDDRGISGVGKRQSPSTRYYSPEINTDDPPPRPAARPGVPESPP